MRTPVILKVKHHVRINYNENLSLRIDASKKDLDVKAILQSGIQISNKER